MIDPSDSWTLVAAAITAFGFMLSLYVAHLERLNAQPHCPRFDIFRGNGIGMLFVSVLCLCLYVYPTLIDGHDRPFAFWAAFTIGYVFTLLGQRAYYQEPTKHPIAKALGTHCTHECAIHNGRNK